ncbi:MAG: reprolysin-like metallopeptidase [Flavobacteriaceae bacterium]
MKAKLHYVLSITMVLCFFSVFAQNPSWKKLDKVSSTKPIAHLNIDISKAYFYTLDFSNLQQRIAKTSQNLKEASTYINVPAQNGTLQAFNIWETPVFSETLALKYPDIKSYTGFATDNSGARLRMSISPNGVETMITYPDGLTIFMQPVTKGATEYVAYERPKKSKLNGTFKCKTIEALKAYDKTNKIRKTTLNEGGANNQTLQKFRIAISTTAEYTAYHYVSDPIADALAAINTTLSRVNEIFEADMAIRFELVDAPQLIYTNASTDPYSNASVGVDGAWSSELQNTLTNEIGNAAYDIGHLFGASGGGGNAGCIGCVCVDNEKGSGYTSPADSSPEGDSFDIDFVAHEIGHQMGANHTFAFENEGEGVSSEPGSGTTIMGYAGLEGSNNVALFSDVYFHYHSIKQILDNLETKNCQTTEVIANSPPLANAGYDYYIPAGTAYILKGSATDANSTDNLTYCWEQIDSGTTNYLNFGPDLATGPTNRSLPPSSAPNRYIPKFSSVLAGKTTQTNPTLGSDWETVSTVARTLNWALTVRDRTPDNATGAQTSFDTMRVIVENVAPFTVNNPVSWAQGSTVAITWNVGETANNSINCQNVSIKLSVDGGATFTTITASTPNNGSYNYTVPATITDTDTARVLIEAVDNIFYDVSDFDFSINTNPNFYITEETLSPIGCGDTSATYTFEYVTTNGFSETTTFTASGQPSGATISFSPSNLSNSGTVTITVDNLENTAIGDYTITVTGTATTLTKNEVFDFPFYNGICASEANTDYDTSTTLVRFNTINQASEKPSGYSNYTATSTDINRKSTYNLTVNVNTDGPYDTVTIVWIDWNQNCSFDAGEAYDLGTATDVNDGRTGNSPLSITVPDNAVLGSTIMRVSTKYRDDGVPTACENGFNGEVEDYTLNITPTASIEEHGFENLAIYPNPNNGTFTINLNGALNRDINTKVFDVRGRLVYQKTFSNLGDFAQEIILTNKQSGMYILRIDDGLKTEVRKLVVR